jgi:hypothetical protein
MSIETLLYATETTAAKEHRCDFCCEKIKVGEVYMKSTHKHEGTLYDWKTHKHCAQIATRLKMYDDADEGVTGDSFQETIHCVHDDLLIDLLVKIVPKEDILKLRDIIQQLRHVSFRYKLSYVIRHYNKIDKATPNS